MSNHFKNNAEKSKFNTRVHNEHRWDEFLKLREDLKRQGVKPIVAWRLAAQSFPPLDGSPLEIAPPPIDQLPPHMRNPGCTGTISPTAEQPHAAEASTVEDQGSVIDGSGWWVDENGEVVDAEVRPPEVKSRGGYTPVQPEIIPSSVLAENNYIEELVAGMDATEIKALPQVLHWVFNNKLTPIRKLKREDIPGTGALAMLQWAQSSATNYNTFLNIWAKMLPTKSDLDKEGRFADDGRAVLSMLDAFEASLKETKEIHDGEEAA